MAGMVFFTDNYQDHSTREGYQFEFYCQRCGNGYSSSFQKSLTGFGGQMLRMGGDLLGGTIGGKASELGWDAQWLTDGTRRCTPITSSPPPTSWSRTVPPTGSSAGKSR